MATKVPLLTAGNFEVLAGSGITIAGAEICLWNLLFQFSAVTEAAQTN
jgi:hypothetical protein